MMTTDGRVELVVPETRALVVGFGSIGRRHARLLEAMGCSVAVVSRRSAVHPNCYPTVTSGLAHARADYVVIATETTHHFVAMQALVDAKYGGRVLVEKPLWDIPEGLFDPRPMRVHVGYVLRFSPLLQQLRRLLEVESPVSIEVRACSYLPDWRPGRDYRATESALRRAGGGVLRDLSHELDYVCWLLGPWRQILAKGGHLSQLEIETEDVCVILAETKRCKQVVISLNYLDRVEERWIIINTTRSTLRADFLTGTLKDGDKVILETGPFDLDLALIQQHAAVLSDDSQPCCTYEQGVEVVNMIAASELSIAEGKWITK